jgi:site-specific recombinase XerD
MRRCGIKKSVGTVSGMHSLRHALARRLLEQGTSLDAVAGIMGHLDYSSTFPYLKVDIAGLRECALSLVEVTDNA